MQGWAERTPAGFLFAVKARQSLTHERERPDCAAFVATLQPLVQAGKLACVLAQFPYSFHPTPDNRAYRAYLGWLREGLGGLPAGAGIPPLQPTRDTRDPSNYGQQHNCSLIAGTARQPAARPSAPAGPALPLPSKRGGVEWFVGATPFVPTPAAGYKALL